jgi:cytochrome c
MRLVFLRTLAPALSLLAMLGAALGAAQAQTNDGDGQIVFNNACRTCHSMREGDHRLGPSLHGVVGRKAGSIKGYAFSSSMRSANIVWDEKTLDQFIADPENVVHGNAMKPFGGISDPKQRGEIIAYLKTISK